MLAVILGSLMPEAASIAQKLPFKTSSRLTYRAQVLQTRFLCVIVQFAELLIDGFRLVCAPNINRRSSAVSTVGVLSKSIASVTTHIDAHRQPLIRMYFPVNLPFIEGRCFLS